MARTKQPQTPTIIIDTREQLPYTFQGVETPPIHRALPTGDYSVDGLEMFVAIERKSLDDFVSTVIHNRDRFKREMDRAKEISRFCLVVETNLDSIFTKQYNSAAHPNSILGAAIAIEQEYRIPVNFCSTRRMAEWFTYRFLYKAWKDDENARKLSIRSIRYGADYPGPCTITWPGYTPIHESAESIIL